MSLGVLFNTDRLDAEVFNGYAQKLDELGYESLWLPELFTRDPYAAAGFLLANTSRIRLATGIANVYGRDPLATVAAAATLQEMSEGRFMLGLGVSNQALNQARGHSWVNPVTKLKNYLSAMSEVRLTSPQPEVPVYVAAHGPKMLTTAAQLADGANTYLMPVEHATQARSILGEQPILNAMLFCLPEENPEVARATARKAISYYMSLDYYHRAWQEFGFSDQDFQDGGSDNLVDAVVAWGDMDQIKQRIHALYTAGVSRVVVIPLGGTGGTPNWQLLETLVD